MKNQIDRPKVCGIEGWLIENGWCDIAEADSLSGNTILRPFSGCADDVRTEGCLVNCGLFPMRHGIQQGLKSIFF